MLFKPTCDKYTPYDPSHRAFPMVRCSCGASTSGSDWDESGKTAVAAWNRRNEQLVERVQELEEALIRAQEAINSMKVEAETAAQGDEQMMLEACETISNEGLDADMEIRDTLSNALPNADAKEAGK